METPILFLTAIVVAFGMAMAFEVFAVELGERNSIWFAVKRVWQWLFVSVGSWLFFAILAATFVIIDEYIARDCDVVIKQLHNASHNSYLIRHMEAFRHEKHIDVVWNAITAPILLCFAYCSWRYQRQRRKRQQAVEGNWGVPWGILATTIAILLWAIYLVFFFHPPAIR